jgi:hypothetical protein
VKRYEYKADDGTTVLVVSPLPSYNKYFFKLIKIINALPNSFWRVGGVYVLKSGSFKEIEPNDLFKTIL